MPGYVRLDFCFNNLFEIAPVDIANHFLSYHLKKVPWSQPTLAEANSFSQSQTFHMKFNGVLIMLSPREATIKESYFF